MKKLDFYKVADAAVKIFSPSALVLALILSFFALAQEYPF